MPLHSPAFLFERVSEGTAGDVIEFVRSIYRGDRYRIVTDLSTQPEARDARSGRIPRVAAAGKR